MKSVPKLIRRFLAILLLSTILLFILNIIVLATLSLSQTPGASPWTTARETGDAKKRRRVWKTGRRSRMLWKMRIRSSLKRVLPSPGW